MLLKLKMKILQGWPSQIVFAKELDFEESRLSKIIRGHVEPNAEERSKLVKLFGLAALKPEPAVKESANHEGGVSHGV